MANNQGKFIVIDGTDGSGKATQTALLVDRLKADGHSVEIADFPQYNTKSAGLVEEYLSGKYGEANDVGPYRASIFYACDRYDASLKIRKWLNDCKIVVSNRYVTANMGHQGGKIKDAMERKKYFDWLYNLEFEIFEIPRPDLNIILHVPAEISQKLSQERTKEDWRGKINDIHQNNLAHLKDAETVYLEIAKTFPGFSLIECARDGQIMAKEEISGLLWKKVKDMIEPEKETEQRMTEQKSGFNASGFWGNAEIYSKTPKNNLNIDFKKSYIQIHGETQEENTEKKSGNLIVERLSPEAKLPSRANENDAGLDLFSLDYYSLAPGEKTTMRTGIKMAIPAGFVGLIWDKSSLAKLGLYTSGGVIDSGYRGEIMINMINLGQETAHIEHGQKIAQILIQKIETPKIIEGHIDDDTERGKGGFGSTGKF